ncbi:MAG: hypothetical protein EOO17_03425 [Chloroflexi bacterium]|nr:MAG: hypothetical protein EOO17_03425 [Chloroflexota bacterium]
MSGQTEYEIHVTLSEDSPVDVVAALRTLDIHGAVVTTVTDRYVGLTELRRYAKDNAYRNPNQRAGHMWNILVRNTGSYRFHTTPFEVVEKITHIARSEYLRKLEKERRATCCSDQWLMSVNSLKVWVGEFLEKPPKGFPPLSRKLLRDWVSQL